MNCARRKAFSVSQNSSADDDVICRKTWSSSMLVHVVQKRQLRVARISKLERVVGCGTWLSNMSDEELSIDEARSHSTEETRGMLNLTLRSGPLCKHENPPLAGFAVLYDADDDDDDTDNTNASYVRVCIRHTSVQSTKTHTFVHKFTLHGVIICIIYRCISITAFTAAEWHRHSSSSSNTSAAAAHHTTPALTGRYIRRTSSIDCKSDHTSHRR